MQIYVYERGMEAEWDAFVRRSRNATFLHLRGFMDYHSHRFEDASILFRDEKGQVAAIFPANRVQQQIVSHGGLTYAGLLLSERMSQAQCLEAFQMLGEHYAQMGCQKIVYKPVPHIFHAYPAEDDLYALFRVGARLVRRDASTAISLRDPFAYTKGRKWSINKGKKAGLTVIRQPDPERFHALLTGVLARHSAQPVHTLDELSLLMGRFPEAIVLYEAVLGDELQAAALIFDLGHAMHTQYLAASDAGRETGALDFLLAEVIAEATTTKRYFSFGISTEQGGTVLNEGLIAQKEGFGGRTVVHDIYEWCLEK